MKDCCRIADLRYKEIINIGSGARLGYVNDVEISIKDGKILALVVPGALRFFGLLGREEDVVIPWEAIERVGDDILLVRHDFPAAGARERLRRRREE